MRVPRGKEKDVMGRADSAHRAPSVLRAGSVRLQAPMIGSDWKHKLDSNEGVLVAGVLSGTSADGIDVALARFNQSSASTKLRPAESVAFETYDFEPDLRARVRAVLDGETCGLGDTALLNRDLGRAFGSAARRLAASNELALDLVGSHGQSVWHHDGREESGPASLQLGDGDHVAEAAGCAVVSDFRQRDVAAGGEGAPLSSLADDELFARAPRPALILNLGGMANLTCLRAGADASGFDTGPAGSLLDGLARRLLDRPFDAEGELTLSGQPSQPLIDELLEGAFFQAAPPKSTGRDTFGEPFVDEFLERAALHGCHQSSDLFASAAHLCGQAVARSLRSWLADLPAHAPLIVAGGGLKNRGLVRALAECSGRQVLSSSQFGVDPDAREALVFAHLALRFVLGQPSTSPTVSGARAGRILGKFSPSAQPTTLASRAGS